MEIKVKYKRPKLPWFVLLFPIGLFIGIATFAFSGDSDFMYLYRLSNAVTALLDATDDSDNYDDKGDNEDYLPSYDIGESTTGTTVATSGTGLNLLLINNIQTECYIKDLLTCATKSQNGEYYDALAHTSVASIITAPCMEHGFYKKSGGVIPIAYFPWDDEANAPYYNKSYNGVPASSMKNEELTQEDVMTMGTQSQVDNKYNNGIFGFSKKATIRKANIYADGKTRSMEGGDHYYFPDVCAQRDSTLDNGLDKLGFTDEDKQKANETSQAALGAYSGLCNNRGYNGGKTMVFGLAYLDTLYNAPDTKVNTDVLTYEDRISLISKVYNDSEVALSEKFRGIDVASVGSSGGACAFAQAILLLESGNGWYCSQEFIDMYTNASSWDKLFYIGKQGWNTLFPDDPISTEAELRTRLEKYKADSVTAAIKQETGVSVSVSDLELVYGIKNDNYDNSANHFETAGWWLHSGFIYCVQNVRSAAYLNKYSDGSDPFLLSSYEVSGLGYYYACSIFGEVVYAKMLKYAGVGVDPTDPSTYLSQFENEWTPTTDEESTLWSTLQANGLDTASLNENRRKVVLAAAALVGIAYHQCRGGSCLDCNTKPAVKCDGYCYNNMSARPTHLDCSAFVWRTYADAGFDTRGFPTSTPGYPGGVFTKIAFEALRPGDVIHRSGHVMIFLGKSGESVYVVHASGHSVGSVYSTKSVYTLQAEKYTFYTYTGIDE